MYFSSKLSIDPSKMTHISRKKPTRAFGKLLYHLTAGAISEKEEQETFTAVSILQQLNMALRSMGIDNIVRLAKDDMDFYLDAEGKENDLKEAMEKFRLETDRYESELFESLFLVIEHEDELMKYLIEIEIQRIHKPGECPIQFSVNGVLNEFNLNASESADDLKKRLNSVFQSQEAYDNFLMQKQAAFNQFIDQLELALKKFIKIDEVSRESNTQIIRPKAPVHSVGEIRHERHSEPIFQGYFGFDSAFFYAWMWAEMSHQHHIHYHNVSVVDEAGNQMFSVGEQGFDAGENNAMNPNAPFEAPNSEDVNYFDGHEYGDEFSNADISTIADSGGDTGEGTDWLKLGGGDSDFFDSDSSCSSCGGCCGGD